MTQAAPAPRGACDSTRTCSVLAIDDAQVLRQLRAALPDDTAWRQVLVTNPAALYGFGT